MTFGITTLSITIKNRDTQHTGTQHCYAEFLWWLSFILNVVIKSIMLCVIMLNVVKQNIIILSVVVPEKGLVALNKTSLLLKIFCAKNNNNYFQTDKQMATRRIDQLAKKSTYQKVNWLKISTRAIGSFYVWVDFLVCWLFGKLTI